MGDSPAVDEPVTTPRRGVAALLTEPMWVLGLVILMDERSTRTSCAG